MLFEILDTQLQSLQAQLHALQTQIIATRALLNAAAPLAAQVDPEPPPGCPHLETENVGTFGAPEYRCTLCKAVIPSPR